MPDALVFYFYKKEDKAHEVIIIVRNIVLVHLNVYLLLPRGSREQFPSTR